MRRSLVLPVLLGVVALLGGTVMSAATAMTDAQFTSAPGAGAAGSHITVASVTPCPPNPAGVAGPRVARVTLARGSLLLGSVQLPVASSGAWTGRLVVAGSATAGAATLDAFCFSSGQAEGATLAYTTRSFTVVAEAPAAPISPVMPAVTG